MSKFSFSMYQDTIEGVDRVEWFKTSMLFLLAITIARNINSSFFPPQVDLV